MARVTNTSSLAALMHNRTQFAGQCDAITLSGGNIDYARFASLLT